MLSPIDIQHHLYSSFLDGRTADVALRVRGSWNALYKLHRVVLIQSGYFRSLFTAGFAESSPRLGVHLKGPEELDLVLDDHNITRAAFEICIAHLYGGGPQLTLPSFLVPTQHNPLSPSFPATSKPSILSATPNGHHPVTPRFLLSLLATSLFLSIPTLASDALSMILNSVGPWTVVGYLRFANGKGIGWNGEWGEWDAEEKPSAVGLENVADPLEDAGTSEAKDIQGVVADAENDLSNRLADAHVADPTPSSPCSSSASLSSSVGKHGVHDTPEPYFYYGAVSDKIGQAVACWLARWGVDMFMHEIRKDLPPGEKGASRTPADQLFKRSIAHLRQRALSVPDNRPSSAPTSTSPFSRSRQLDKTDDLSVPAIWGVKGLDATWVAALISADTLFVKGERERYDLAAAVVEMRRRQGGVLADEEAVWKGLFEKGVYYVNMSVEDIMHIAEDISPTTNSPYVSLRVLQAAHWDQAMLRQKILATPSTTSSLITGTTPTSSHKDIGVALSTADILTQASTPQADSISETRYYNVHSDSSMRLGDTGGLARESTSSDGKTEPVTMEQLYAFASGETSTVIASPSGEHGVPLSPTRSGESTFFGLHAFSAKDLPAAAKELYPIPLPLSPSQVPHLDVTGKHRWSPYPPYRFAVEFWDIDWLKEKSRLHSHTIWYAGSLFNVYVQVVWKKVSSPAPPSVQNGLMQVGVYIHRQSSVEAVPSCSRPSSDLIAMRNSEERETRHVRGPSMPALSASTSRTSHYSPSIHPPSRSATPNPPSAPSSPVAPHSPPSLGQSASSSQLAGSYSSTPGITLPAVVPSQAPHQPYRDPRSLVQAYFTISCASATGTAQTRFSSSPDVFAISQSWGWKSSSLTLRVGSGSGTPDSFINKPTVGKNDEVSLRATVVLGIV